jgi:glycosyl hydrolase family 10
MKLSRRHLLKGLGSVSSAMFLARPPGALEAGHDTIELTQEHRAAVDRRRRIVVQDDPSNFDPDDLYGMNFDEWIEYRFSYADQPGSQIDSIWWDLENGDQAVYRSRLLPRFEHPGMRKWWDQGIDWVGELIKESRKRNLEVFWHHRINKVEIRPLGGLEMEHMHAAKKKHPNWVIGSWWWQGLWNFAIPEVRDYRLSILKELVNEYDLDGIHLDFARHVPVLPPGRQWELRDHVTEFVRMVRLLLLEVEKKRARPFLLAAKVPRTLEGCRVDGFDVETWARQDLVDILTLGSRSMDVDVVGFRRATAGRHIKLQPCFDDHHTTDGYRFGPIEFLRGVFGNWWQQGADSVVTFNWSNAPPAVASKIGARPGPVSHQQGYTELGSPETLRFKNKVFAVERRGGYPWSEGYFNRNDTAPLPVRLSNGGRPARLTLRISDPVKTNPGGVKQLMLRAVLFGQSGFRQSPQDEEPGRSIPGQDEFEVRINGVVLRMVTRDNEWKDPQIFSPWPQPISGGRGDYSTNLKQKLLRLDYSVDPALCRLGENQVELRILTRTPYLPGQDIDLEKLEIHLEYLHSSG